MKFLGKHTDDLETMIVEHHGPVEDLGIDPEVTRLSQVVVDQIRALARLLGYDRPDPRVLIDRRTQTVNIGLVEGLSDDEFSEALEALGTLRELGDGKLFDQLIDAERQR